MQHNDDEKEWGALGSWDLVPSDKTYKPKINSRTVQGEKNGDGAQKKGVGRPWILGPCP